VEQREAKAAPTQQKCCHNTTRTYLIADIAAVAFEPDGGPQVDLQRKQNIKVTRSAEKKHLENTPRACVTSNRSWTSSISPRNLTSN
jgi:hypothetical protein